jgi:hypothetical protein
MSKTETQARYFVITDKPTLLLVYFDEGEKEKAIEYAYTVKGLVLHAVGEAVDTEVIFHPECVAEDTMYHEKAKLPQ